MRFIFIVIAFLIIFTLIFPFSLGSSVSTINAEVDVGCYFINNIKSQNAVYIIPQSIDLIYSAKTLKTLNGCSLNLTGNIIIVNNTNTTVYQKAIQFNNVNATAQSKTLIVNSDKFQPALYTALMKTSSSISSNSNQTSFIVLAPANIIVKNIEVSPSSVARYSIIMLSGTIINNGALSSSNLLATIKITGPSGFSYITTQSIPSLSAGSLENFSLSLHGLTNYAGSYIVTENISYYSNYYYNNTNYTYGPYMSNEANTTYSVYVPYYQSSSGASGIPPSQQFPPPLPSVPKASGISLLKFLIYPFFVSVPSGSSIIKEIGLSNPTNSSIVVNINTNQTKNVSVGLSSNVVVIPPHKSIYVNALFSAASNTSGRLINIPLNFTLNTNNKTYYSNGYTTLSITAPNNNLLNYESSGDIVNSSQFYLSINLNNPTNKTLKNITVTYPLPIEALNKSSNIMLSGGTHTINISNNNYVMQWYIPELQPHSESSLNGAILNISNAEYLNFVQPLVYTTIQTAPLIKLLGVSAPPIYANSSAIINVTLFYSGSIKNNITLSLTGPIGVNISQPITINTYPNELIREKFYISNEEIPGIRDFVLHATGKNINANYTIPLIIMSYAVIAKPTYAELINQNLFPISYTVIFALIIILLAYYSIKRSRRAKYKPKRLNELKKIRERIENNNKIKKQSKQ